MLLGKYSKCKKFLDSQFKSGHVWSDKSRYLDIYVLLSGLHLDSLSSLSSGNSLKWHQAPLSFLPVELLDLQIHVNIFCFRFLFEFQLMISSPRIGL